MEFYRHDIVVAKKEHECEFCKEKIKPGTSYHYECGKYDGDFFVRKLCKTCYSAMNDFLYQSYDSEFDYNEIMDFLAEKFCYDCVHGGEKDDDCKEYYKCQKIIDYYSKEGE